MKSEGGGAGASVAIIGGGFSGTVMAAQLARRGIGSMLFEGGGRLARGIAYSTQEPAHLLNVRASMMSAWPDDPDHFARLMEAEGGNCHDFAERRRFGRYLGAILDEAVATGLVKPITARAITAARANGHWRIELDDGGTAVARSLVLAIGNQTPEPMRVAAGISEDRFVNNPWGEEARGTVERLAGAGGDVLILGTGLTMIDMVLSLDAAEHKGRMLALSRRGQIPRSHTGFTPAPVEEAEVPHGDLLALWRWLRHRGGQVGWRAAVDSLRPYSQGLWQALDSDDQQRFMRHARPWWDVHRHRIAPEVAQRIAELVAEGRLEIAAGRVKAISEIDGGIEVAITRRLSTSLGTNGVSRQQFSVAFNCTGPLGRMAATQDALLKQMIGDGMVAIDDLGLGLEVDGDSRAGEHIWALGPLAKGRYWEIIAVPDIREQTASVAADIATELGS